MLFVTVQPFKEGSEHFTTISIVSTLFLGLGYISSMASSMEIAHPQLLLGLFAIVGIFPLIYISAITLHWIYKRCRDRAQGYEEIP